jgi:hypothetical protein
MNPSDELNKLRVKLAEFTLTDSTQWLQCFNDICKIEWLGWLNKEAGKKP